MCVYNTDAEDISKARTRTIKPQNQHFLRTGFLSDLLSHIVTLRAVVLPRWAVLT